MIVLVLLIVGLAIALWHLLNGFWALLLAVAVVCALCRWLVAPLLYANRASARDRLRHQRARREIERIAFETRRGMYDAALRHADVIEGTAVEIEQG